MLQPKTMRYNIQTVCLLVSLSLLLQQCGDATAAGQEAEKPREVRTAIVEAVDFRETITGTGRLSAREEIRLSFKTGGILSRFFVDEGDKVRAGQRLATLELEEIQAQNRKAELSVDQAAINLDNAQLALKLAERDYRNAKGLFQDSVATLEQLENAEVQLDNARNRLQAAEKALELNRQNVEVADYNLRYSTITAPTRGTILRKLAETGELVGPGNPVLLLGSEERTKVLRVDVTDREIVQLQEGVAATVHFDAYPGVSFSGRLIEKAALADPMTGTYTIEVAVAPGKYELLSGLIGRVSLAAGKATPLLRIPVDAISRGDGDQVSIFVVDNGLARKRILPVYKLDGESFLVRGGLTASDTVITSGVGYISDGDQVKSVQ